MGLISGSKRYFREFILIIFYILITTNLYSTNSNINVYLFPGQGSDERLFSKLDLGPGYTLHPIHYGIPPVNISLKEFAFTFISKIDTTTSFILIGVSLGGMICTEISQVIKPLRTIIISSAKTSDELPGRYTFQRMFPLNKLIPSSLIKGGAMILQPVFEPDRNKEKDIFKAMISSRDPIYLKRTIHMIINWDRKEIPGNLIHIHGDMDNTIPIMNVKADHIIKNGSHMMMLTRADEINAIIRKILEDPKQDT